MTDKFHVSGHFLGDERRLLQVGPGKSILPRKKRNSWEQCISIFGEPLTGAPFPRKYNGISSSFCQSRSSSWQSRSCLRLRTSTPSAFLDRTSFCLSNRKLEKAFVSGQPKFTSVEISHPTAFCTI